MRTHMYILFVVALLLAACGQGASTVAPTNGPGQATEAPAVDASPAETTASTANPQRLVVMTHDSFAVSTEVIQQFERENNASVQILQSGDAGAALNKAILSKDTPQADVFFGVDNTFLSRALAAEIFEPYTASALASVPEQYKLDPSSRLTPIDYGYVSLNYDKAYVEKNGLAVPQSLRDLTKPEWKSKLVVENPATSSPGLAFLLASIAEFGTEGDYTYLDFWRDLRANDVLVTEGWDDAYYREFSGASGKGPRPLVVSYASSPPSEVIFADTALTDAPTAVVTASSFLQVEFAGILKGTKQQRLAQKFIDFMLSSPFQQDMPLQMFVYPVQPATPLPEAFAKYSTTPEKPLSVPPEQIEANREQWIDSWTQTVLR